MPQVSISSYLRRSLNQWEESDANISQCKRVLKEVKNKLNLKKIYSYFFILLHIFKDSIFSCLANIFHQIFFSIDSFRNIRTKFNKWIGKSIEK